MTVKQLKRRLRALRDKLSGNNWVRLQNVANALRGNPMRYAYADGLYRAADHHGSLWFPNQKRSFFLNDGLQRRLRILSQQYRLTDIRLDPGDIVVDVGANIGEIGVWLKATAPGVRYIAFEPSPREYSCLRRNAADGTTYNCGLWYEAAELRFYLNSAEADSSLIEPASFDHVQDVPCGRLDELVLDRPIKLLKVDAEGAEPEVLRGARDLLPHCQHVVVDAGPERGVEQVATAPEVINYMVAHGFDVVEVDTGRLVVAFRNREQP